MAEKPAPIPLIAKHIHDHIKSAVDHGADLHSEDDEHVISTIDKDDSYSPRKLTKFIKDKGWAVSGHRTYDKAVTSEGPFPGTTHSYKITKGKEKKEESYYVSHAHADPEDSGLYTEPYHEVTITRTPQDKLHQMKSTFVSFQDWLHRPDNAKHLDGLRNTFNNEMKKKQN